MLPRQWRRHEYKSVFLDWCCAVVEHLKLGAPASPKIITVLYQTLHFPSSSLLTAGESRGGWPYTPVGGIQEAPGSRLLDSDWAQLCPLWASGKWTSRRKASPSVSPCNNSAFQLKMKQFFLKEQISFPKYLLFCFLILPPNFPNPLSHSHESPPTTFRKIP